MSDYQAMSGEQAPCDPDIEAEVRREQRVADRLQALEQGARQSEARVSALEANAALLQAARSFMRLEAANAKLLERVTVLEIEHIRDMTPEERNAFEERKALGLGIIRLGAHP